MGKCLEVFNFQLAAQADKSWQVKALASGLVFFVFV